jgi:hypothetical protein
LPGDSPTDGCRCSGHVWRVHIDDELEPDLVEPREAEVRHLDGRAFGSRQDYAGVGERRSRTVPRRIELVLREHPDLPPDDGSTDRSERYFAPISREYDSAP